MYILKRISYLIIFIFSFFFFSYRYQFPPLDPLWHKILGLVMIVLGVLGWSGNGVVVYVFLMTPSLRTPSNLLVVNLAFSDFIMMIIMSPPMVINCYYETWILGNEHTIFIWLLSYMNNVNKVKAFSFLYL